MDTKPLFTGSCLCGLIRYAYSGEPGSLVLCHCADCRKANGSAFNANIDIQADGFVIRSGKEQLKAYRSTPGKQRFFCGNCGSPLYSRKDQSPGTLGLRIGTIDTPLELKPAVHQFVASKAAWYEIDDWLPQYPTRMDSRASECRAQ